MSQPTISGIPQGLRVVVTAGASGIGRAIAETLREHGARVHVCDISPEALDECRAAMPDVGVALADVADIDQVDAFFDGALAELGGLDVLINNAGIAGPTAGVEEIEPGDWDRTVAVNLNGMFYCARRAVPVLRETGQGAIINLSSVAGRLGFAYRTPYAATKWAVVGFTQSLAKELGPDGIRVNAILPGVVEGPRIERVIAARAEALGKSYAEVERENLSKVSLRRMVSPYDVANMALFLCSPAGQNISGQALSVCGNVEAI
jgi:NAD(P)-dependent dehydrogenase (short-subunit alcohol dehydrogenase family)